ncbi:hypothetical protein [Streptomyces sp. NPDC059861]|uniref:hypothetical protein n=1 Tax=Streptomyces sp. NPDC059861 TaxID=3346974 RepID=UPI0036470F07
MSSLSRAAASPAHPDAEAAAVADHCGSGCSDILPPGRNGNATLAQRSSSTGRPGAVT